jgi:hypothetical protein
MYKGAVRKRNRAGTDDAEDIHARLADLSYGHGGRTPMPEIEMLDNVHDIHALGGAAADKVTHNDQEHHLQSVQSGDDASSSSPLSVDSDDVKVSQQQVV